MMRRYNVQHRGLRNARALRALASHTDELVLMGAAVLVMALSLFVVSTSMLHSQTGAMWRMRRMLTRVRAHSATCHQRQHAQD